MTQKPARSRKGDIVDRYMQAWNDQDAERVRDCFTDDGCYMDSVHEREIVGDEIIAYCEDSFEKYPDMHYTIINRAGSGTGSVAVQWLMSGTGVERMFGQPVSGERVSCLGVDFLTLRDRRIHTCTSHYDVSSLERGVDRALRAGREQATLEKYQRTRLSDGTVDDIRARLEQRIGEAGGFANPGLSLAGLAADLDISPTYLSQVINRSFQMTFRDYLNMQRVRLAGQLLQDPVHADTPVLELGFAAGFNSGSAFYTAFRRFTGTTPLNFRKQNKALPGNTDS